MFELVKQPNLWEVRYTRLHTNNNLEKIVKKAETKIIKASSLKNAKKIWEEYIKSAFCEDSCSVDFDIIDVFKLEAVEKIKLNNKKG